MNKEELQEIAKQLACTDGEGGLTMAENMNKMNDFITMRSIDRLALIAGESVVEIGPGNGLLSQRIVRSLGDDGLFFGLERSATMAGVARKNLARAGAGQVDIFHGDCLDAPIAAGSMDAVMAVNVLYFIDDLHGFFEKLTSWLRPGGRAVFGIRSPETMRRMPFTQYGFNMRPYADIESIMRNYGFNQIDSDCHDEGVVTLAGVDIQVDSIIIKGVV